MEKPELIEISKEPELVRLLQAEKKLAEAQGQKRSATGELGFQSDLKKARSALAQYLRQNGITAAMLYPDQAAIE